MQLKLRKKSKFMALKEIEIGQTFRIHYMVETICLKVNENEAVCLKSGVLMTLLPVDEYQVVEGVFTNDLYDDEFLANERHLTFRDLKVGECFYRECEGSHMKRYIKCSKYFSSGNRMEEKFLAVCIDRWNGEIGSAGEILLIRDDEEVFRYTGIFEEN